MLRNVGPKERIARIAAGAFAAIAARKFARSRSARTVLGMVAASGLGSGLSSYCPMNQLLGRGKDLMRRSPDSPANLQAV